MEFSTNEAMQKICFDLNSHAVISPFVWFKAGKKIKPLSPLKKSLSVNAAKEVASNNEIFEWMTATESV